MTDTQEPTTSPTSLSRLFVISAPSGTGKSTIATMLKEQGIVDLSVSHTTRTPRQKEKEGEQYFFISHDEFVRLRDSDSFLEWADVFGHLYGTSAKWVKSRIARGQNILLELDIQGALQVKQHYPSVVMIFILPPSIDELAARLEKRGTNTPQSIAIRLAAAENEIAQGKEFNYAIINDDLTHAFNQVREIIISEQNG